jgi:hypothetical protein
VYRAMIPLLVVCGVAMLVLVFVGAALSALIN